MRFSQPVVARLDITYEALNLPGDPDQVLFNRRSTDAASEKF